MVSLNKLKPGKYVLAVSGGVDSVALLHMLAGQDSTLSAGYSFVVAHIDHGIRQESSEDLEFVRNLASEFGLPYYWLKVSLGQGASEADAREVRYGFLFSLLERVGANKVVTAHHQDDLTETSLMHVMRGTGRRGLAGFGTDERLVRPLLGMTKLQLQTYAKGHNLKWHEDSTNKDTTYKRNFVRHELLPQLTAQNEAFESKWLQLVGHTSGLNEEIEKELQILMKANMAQKDGKYIFARFWFASLPHIVAREVVVALLREAKVRDISKKRVEQLTIRLKTAKINKRYDVDGTWEFQILQDPFKQTILKLAQKEGEC